MQMTAFDSKSVVAVTGAGTMGSGIAQVAAQAGHPVLLYDSDQLVLSKAVSAIDSRFNRLVERGKLSTSARDEAMSRISIVTGLPELASAALVIEAIAEDLSVKQTLFKNLESVCAADTIFASNTSSLSITDIASTLERPERVAGMHFFNPAPVMKLVEVVSGSSTSKETAQIIFDTAKNWGKQPVHCKSTPGFVVNRIARPFYGEALRLMEEDATNVPTLDACLREAGAFRMGPFELMDVIGLDVNYAVTESIYKALGRDVRFMPSRLQKQMVDKGLLGRKTGRGFYDYESDETTPLPDTLPLQAAPGVVELPATGPLRELWQNSFLKAGLKTIFSNQLHNYIRVDNVYLGFTDGRSAAQRRDEENINELVLYDLCLDFNMSPRIILCKADQTNHESLEKCAALFQILGKQVSVINDVPAMIVLRIVCMLINIAADAVHDGVCDEAAVDTAMKTGVNYPKGPFEWADMLGISFVANVLSYLANNYKDDRYRVCSYLNKKN